MKLLRKKSNYIWVLIYGFFYIISFICLERSNAQPHLIHSVVMGIMGAGLTAFIIISFVYPNGQELRPALGEGEIFIQAVKLLYRLDTPTNILPSMHVFALLHAAWQYSRMLN